MFTESRDGFLFVLLNKQQTVARFQRSLHRGTDTVAAFFGDFYSVYYDFDVVYFVAIHLHFRSQIDNRAVHSNLRITLLTYLLEQLPVMPFPTANNRRENNNFFARKSFHNLVDHLLLCVAHHAFAGHVRVGISGTRKQQTHEIVYLGDGADRRARIAPGGFLLNGNDGTQTRYFFHVGALHTAHELPRVGGKSFHIAALPFGIYRVECEGRFAAAADTRHDHEFVARYGYVHVFEVVDACADDFDVTVFVSGLRCFDCCFGFHRMLINVELRKKENISNVPSVYENSCMLCENPGTGRKFSFSDFIGAD